VSLLRGILFENMGLKLVALLLALVVYLHVYTDRPATQVMNIPVETTQLADSLAIVTQNPMAVAVELKGTGKQLIRLRLSEPRLTVSLEGVGPGHFQRTFTVEDLPSVTQVGLQVSRFAGPQMLELTIDRYDERDVPVAARIEGTLPPGASWSGDWTVDPPRVRVRGPKAVLAKLDSVRLAPVKLDAAHDTLKVVANVASPVGSRVTPAVVTLRVPIVRGGR
jgi:YbbR domain-containing protein